MRVKPVWLEETLSWTRCGPKPRAMEQAAAFYTRAAGQTSDAATRKLLGDLAAAEAGHAERQRRG
jgi:rubrerythrin